MKMLFVPDTIILFLSHIQVVFRVSGVRIRGIPGHVDGTAVNHAPDQLTRGNNQIDKEHYNCAKNSEIFFYINNTDTSGIVFISKND